MNLAGSSVAEADRVDAIEYWATRWREQKTGWHMNKVNPLLLKYLNRLAQPSQSKKFFLPLCGMTYDIGYLLALGHSVFAVEGVKEIIAELSTRDNLGLEFNEQDSTFSSPDGKAVIYIGDILDCPIEKWGPFDVVWDRASLIAMNYVNRKAYIDIIRRSVRKSHNEYCDFAILLEVVNYDKSAYPGPPRAVDENDMLDLFGSWTSSEELHTGPGGESFPRVISSVPAESLVTVTVYLLTPKL